MQKLAKKKQRRDDVTADDIEKVLADKKDLEVPTSKKLTKS